MFLLTTPVSSLDDNHLIDLAQTLATLIKSAQQDGPEFIITTHNPLFFNVLFNALKKGLKYQLSQSEDGASVARLSMTSGRSPSSKAER